MHMLYVYGPRFVHFVFALLLFATLFGLLGCLSPVPKSNVTEVSSVPLASNTNKTVSVNVVPIAVPTTSQIPLSTQNITNITNNPVRANATNFTSATLNQSDGTNTTATMGAHPPDLFTSETPLPKMPTFNFTNVTSPEGKLMVYYFYSSACGACRAIQPEIIALSVKYNKTTEWQFYDLTIVNGTLGYVAYADWKGLNNSQRMIPQVMVNGTLITDRFNIHEKLEPMLANFTRE